MGYVWALRWKAIGVPVRNADSIYNNCILEGYHVKESEKRVVA